MELRSVVSFYKKYCMKVAIGVFACALLGVGAFFLPPKYVALGSFVVVRDTEPPAADFSYEGYYAQLTSQDFSKNLIAFFKNESVLQKISTDMKMDRTELKRKIRVVKEAPSVSRLEVSHSSPDKARAIWVALRDEVLDIVAKTSQGTDPSIKVLVIGDEPVVRHSYRNVYVFGAVGAMLGFLFASFYFGGKEYLR